MREEYARKLEQADRVLFSQVRTNLFSNAAKYTPPGGRIEVAVESDGGQDEVRVKFHYLPAPSDVTKVGSGAIPNRLALDVIARSTWREIRVHKRPRDW